MQQQSKIIDSPRFNAQLRRLWEPLRETRHQLIAIGNLDVLFIPEQQLAFVACGNNPVNRYSAPSADIAIAAYKAQRLMPELFQAVLSQPVVNQSQPRYQPVVNRLACSY